MSAEALYSESLIKIVKGAGFTFIAVLVGGLCGYLLRAILARFLGSHEYGLLSIGLASLSILVLVGTLGLGEGISRYVAYYKGRNDVESVRTTILSATLLNLPAGIIVAILLFIFSDFIADHIFGYAHLAPLLRILSISIPLSILYQNFTSSLIGFQQIKQPSLLSISENVSKLTTVFILLYFGFGLLGAGIAYIIPMFFLPFIALMMLHKNFIKIGTPRNLSKISKELITFSAPLLLVGLSGLVLEWTDTLMLGVLKLSIDVGVYNAALPTARLLMTVSFIFGMIYTPVTTGMYVRGMICEMEMVYKVTTRWMLSLLLPVFLILVLFPSTTLNLIFGSEYVEGAHALIILSFGYFVGCVFSLAAPMLESVGKTKVIMFSYFVGAFLNVTLNIILIPLYGINGAAVATAISFIIIKSLPCLFVHIEMKIHPFDSVQLKPMLSSLISVCIVYFPTKYMIGTSLPAIIVMLLAFFILYLFILLLIGGFTEDDLIVMRAIDEKYGNVTGLFTGIIRKFL